MADDDEDIDDEPVIIRATRYSAGCGNTAPWAFRTGQERERVDTAPVYSHTQTHTLHENKTTIMVTRDAMMIKRYWTHNMPIKLR